jgi:CDP-diacylglycerol---serine O-phosphatidyltransferase
MKMIQRLKGEEEDASRRTPAADSAAPPEAWPQSPSQSESLDEEVEEISSDEEVLPPGRRGERIRRRMLRSTAMLPALFTISNGLCGFAAIHFATKDGVGAARMLNLWISGWLIVAAMVCDMLDGRLARLARRTSDFGGQLDSLSDAISFGVAPAMLMARTVLAVLRRQATSSVFLERAILCVGGVYVACAILRLARFNVENEPDEAAHMRLAGLPSPAAAGGIASLVLLLAFHFEHPWEAASWLPYAVSILLPIVALAGALLMVSRVEYPHLVNQYIRGKRPFSYLVKLVVVALGVMLAPLETAACVSLVFIVWPPLRGLARRLRKHGDAAI